MRKMKTGLNDRHRLILDYLKKKSSEHNFSPTLRDIGKALGVRSVSLVNYYLELLELEGYIHREKISPHKIEITLTNPGQGNNPPSGIGGRAVHGELVIIPIIGVFKNDCIYPLTKLKNSPFYGKDPIDTERMF
jgi:repressor LexA